MVDRFKNVMEELRASNLDNFETLVDFAEQKSRDTTEGAAIVGRDERGSHVSSKILKPKTDQRSVADFALELQKSIDLLQQDVDLLRKTSSVKTGFLNLFRKKQSREGHFSLLELHKKDAFDSYTKSERKKQAEKLENIMQARVQALQELKAKADL